MRCAPKMVTYIIWQMTEGRMSSHIFVSANGVFSTPQLHALVIE